MWRERLERDGIGAAAIRKGPSNSSAESRDSRPLCRGITQTAAGTWAVTTKIAGAKKNDWNFSLRRSSIQSLRMCQSQN